MSEFIEGKWYRLPNGQAKEAFIDDCYTANRHVADIIGTEPFRVDFAKEGVVYKIYVPEDDVSYEMSDIMSSEGLNMSTIISAAEFPFFIECDEPSVMNDSDKEKDHAVFVYSPTSDSAGYLIRMMNLTREEAVKWGSDWLHDNDDDKIVIAKVKDILTLETTPVVVRKDKL